MTWAPPRNALRTSHQAWPSGVTVPLPRYPEAIVRTTDLDMTPKIHTVFTILARGRMALRRTGHKDSIELFAASVCEARSWDEFLNEVRKWVTLK